MGIATAEWTCLFLFLLMAAAVNVMLIPKRAGIAFRLVTTMLIGFWLAAMLSYAIKNILNSREGCESQLNYVNDAPNVRCSNDSFPE
jgi:hypothetical protein